MEIITRERAKELGLKSYYTGIPCKHGHIAERNTKMGMCMECNRLNCAKIRNRDVEAANAKGRASHHKHKEARNKNSNAYYAEHSEEINAKKREDYLENKDEISARNKKWKEANPNYAIEYFQKYYKDNGKHLRDYQKEYREKFPEKVRTSKRREYERNPNAYISRARERRTNIEVRTPSWADIFQINEIYRESIRLTEETGIPHHVDHIIPLSGKDVSGLHIHTNLRIIPAHENLTKHNKFIPELLIQYPSEPNIQI